MTTLTELKLAKKQLCSKTQLNLSKIFQRETSYDMSSWYNELFYLERSRETSFLEIGSL